MLEAGGKDNSIWMKVPAEFQKLLTHPKHNWCFKAEPEGNLAGRSIHIGSSDPIAAPLIQPNFYPLWLINKL